MQSMPKEKARKEKRSRSIDRESIFLKEENEPKVNSATSSAQPSINPKYFLMIHLLFFLAVEEYIWIRRPNITLSTDRNLVIFSA